MQRSVQAEYRSQSEQQYRLTNNIAQTINLIYAADKNEKQTGLAAQIQCSYNKPKSMRTQQTLTSRTGFFSNIIRFLMNNNNTYMHDNQK